MDHINITVPAAIPMVALVGPNDSYIKILEGAFPNIVITVRGNEILGTGSQIELKKFEEILSEFLVLLRGGQTLSEDTIIRSISMFNNEEHPAEILSLNILSNRGKTIRPKTSNQKKYVAQLLNRFLGMNSRKLDQNG